MEFLTDAINATIESFDFAFCISVNVMTYILITIAGNKANKKDLNTWAKRGILLISIVIVGVVYYINGSDLKLIINSSILAPVFWSWIMKPICKKLKIDYKQLSLFE